MTKSELKEKIKNLLEEAQKDKGSDDCNFSIKNCNINNLEVYQNSTIINKEKKSKRKSSTSKNYPIGTIGANKMIVDNINDLIKTIISARTEVGNRTPQQIAIKFYIKFNKDFGIKSKDAIWHFPEERANEIIEYLNDKYYNTKKGRIEKAAKKKDYEHNVGHYFRIEQEILSKLGKDSHDVDLVDLRFRLFNVKSRKELTLPQWKIYISELDRKLEIILGN